MKKFLRAFQYRVDEIFHRSRLTSIAMEAALALARKLGPDARAQSVDNGKGLQIDFHGDRALYLAWPTASPTMLTLQAYCAILSRSGSIGTSAYLQDFHQYGQILSKDSWVWYPRIKEGGPTSYSLNYLPSSKTYRWRHQVVGQKQPAYSSGMSRDELIAAFTERLFTDATILSDVLANAVEQK